MRNEFGGANQKKVFETAAKYADGKEVAVIAMQAGIDWMQSDGVAGHASSWEEVVKVLHDNGYRILRSGDVSAYTGAEQNVPYEAAVIIVTVLPRS